MGLTAQECRDRCTENLQCGCVTYARENGQCWMRANCVPSGWTSPYNIGYNVYMKNTQPNPACVSGGDICGGPGILTMHCCDGYECQDNADAVRCIALHCVRSVERAFPQRQNSVRSPKGYKSPLHR